MYWTEQTIRGITIPSRAVEGGSLIVLTGKSGSGKTTLLEHFYHEAIRQHGRNSVRYMKQDVIMHPDLTVKETLQFYHNVREGRVLSSDELDSIMTKLRIDHLAEVLVGALEHRGISGGEKKRVYLASLLLDRRSTFLILDEPFSGLDNENIHRLFELFEQHKQAVPGGCCFLLSSHHLPASVYTYVDERWDIREHRLIYEKLENSLEQGGGTSLELSRTSQDTTRLRMRIQEIGCLLNREWTSQKRNPKGLLLTTLVPLIVMLLQSLLMGFLSDHVRRWRSTGSLLDFYIMMFNYNILLFTASILPLHRISDHMTKQLCLSHEISQGLYHKDSSFWSSLLLESVLLLFLSVVMSLLSFIHLWNPWFLMTLVMNLASVMLSMNMMMMIASFFFRQINIVLLFLIGYSSFSFLFNIGVMLLFKNRFMMILQYLSIIHQQSNLFLLVLAQEFPDQRAVTEGMRSFLNLSNSTFFSEPWQWMTLTGGFLLVPPLLMMLRT